jgi:hypothetical protein
MERDAFLHVRVPLALKERIAESARSNRRSLVREVQVLLERAVSHVPDQPQVEVR